MKRFISVLFIFGITLVFQQSLDGGFAFRNYSDTDVMVIIDEEWAVFSCSDGERFRVPANELKSFLGQLWIQHGPPADLWKIERIPPMEEKPEQEESPKSGDPLT